MHTSAAGRTGRRGRGRATAAVIGAAVGVVAVVALAGPAFADIEVNGSFEDGAAGTYEAGSAAVPGWTIVAGNVDVFGGDFVIPDGQQILDLAGSGAAAQPATIQQQVPTEADVTYIVSWSYGAHGDGDSCGGEERTGDFYVGDTLLSSMAATWAGATDPNWQQTSVSFVGTGAPVTLTFVNTTTEAPPACGLAIDNIVMAQDTEVPLVDPRVAALVLGTVAVVLGAWFWTRRRNHRNGERVVA